MSWNQIDFMAWDISHAARRWTLEVTTSEEPRQCDVAP